MSDQLLGDHTRVATLGSLQFSDGRFVVDVFAATITGEFVDDIDGASTLSLTLRDYNRTLLLSPLITDYKKPGREVDIKVPSDVPGGEPVWYRLLKVKKQGKSLALTFEDRSVAFLRVAGKSKGRIYTRGSYTRAQAGLALIRLQTSPKIKVVCPEASRIQPISTKPLTDAQREAAKGPGFVADAGITVKKVDAEREQMRNIARILDVGISMKAKRPVLIAAVMATTQEATARNLAGGDRDSVGLFQIRKMHVPRGEKDRRRDVEWQARWFFTRAIPIYRSRPSIKPNDLAQQVERSAHPMAYQAWAEEATATVDAYLGRTTASTAKQGARVAKKYTFVKKADETIWDTLGKWFSEVNWKRYATRNVVYLISEPALLASRPRMRITEDTEGIENGIDFDIDGGKEVDKATFNVRAAAWVAPAGDVVELYDCGPADGRWIVSTRRRSITSTQMSITLKRPAEPLPEPAPSTQTAAAGEKTGVALLDDAYALAKEIDKKNWVYVWGGGHARAGSPSSGPDGVGYDCSGLASAIAKEIGALTTATDTVGFGRLGKPGKGKYLTFYVKPYSGASGHIYMVFKRPGHAEERFEAHGPRGARIGFMPRGSDSGYQARHIEGL